MADTDAQGNNSAGQDADANAVAPVQARDPNGTEEMNIGAPTQGTQPVADDPAVLSGGVAGGGDAGAPPHGAVVTHNLTTATGLSNPPALRSGGAAAGNTGIGNLGGAPVPTDHPTTIDTGAPINVSIENIETQLSELWRNVAETAQMRGGTQAVTMAQVLNLIVHAGSDAEANECISDTEKITGRHPCRVICTMVDQRGDEQPVQASVSMFCQLPPAGGRQVCCEQVMVAASGNSVRQLPAAILPLLMPDLPVFLWWPQGAPFDDYVFRQLADSLNRLIVDSATFENPEGVLSRLSTLMKGNWPHIASTDMNWGRVTPWRELIAGFFDSPALRPYLDRINNITIEFAVQPGKPVNRAQCIMIAGWLASRLGWQPADNVYRLEHSPDSLPATAHLSLRSGKRPINITMKPNLRASEIRGDICRVRIEVPGDPPQNTARGTQVEGSQQAVLGDEPKLGACFEVSLAEQDSEPGSAWTNVEVDGSVPTNRNIQIEALTRADLLDNELEVYSRDRVYEEALDMVANFIRGGLLSGPEGEGPRKITTGEPMSAGAQIARTRPPGVPPR